MPAIKTTSNTQPIWENHLKTALPGNPLTKEEFIAWVEAAELSPTMSLDEAKRKWTNRMKGSAKS